MNIKDQVLSIEQVRELQELGFDVNEYGIFFIAEGFYDSNKYIVNEEMLNNEVIYNEIREYFPTLTIWDIMDILPEEIEEKVLNIFAFGETWSVGWEGIQYCGSNKLIDALFETLKWCIKERHIEL